MQQSIKGKNRGKVVPSTVPFIDILSLQVLKRAPHLQEMYSSELGKYILHIFLQCKEWAESKEELKKLTELTSAIFHQKIPDTRLWRQGNYPTCLLSHMMRTVKLWYGKRVRWENRAFLCWEKVWTWIVRLRKMSNVPDSVESGN